MKTNTVSKQRRTFLTNLSIIFNISCVVVIVFILNLDPARYKYVTIKCIFKRYPPLLTSIAPNQMYTNVVLYSLSWKLERIKLSIANQTLAMILDLLSFMSKDRVSLITGFNVTRIYPVIVTLHVR